MIKIDNYFSTENGGICCCVLIVFFFGSIIAYFVVLPYGIPAIYFYFGIVIFLCFFFPIFIYFDALTYCEFCKKRVRPILKDHICEIDQLKSRKKIKKPTKYQKKLILKKIKDFSKEFPYANVKQMKILINRMMRFIDNELPNDEKYNSYKIKLETLLSPQDSFNNNIFETVAIIESILIDLKSTVELDSFESLSIFSVDLHPKIKIVSLELYKNGHYSQAIFEAVKLLNNYVKKKAKITDGDLSNAMAKAFNEKNPIIKLNKLSTQSERDEQEGFRFLFQGAMKGIRNPKGHEIHEMKDKNEALEHLAFISLLFRKAEQGTL